MSDDDLWIVLFGCYLFVINHCAELAFQALERQLILSNPDIQTIISEYMSVKLC